MPEPLQPDAKPDPAASPPAPPEPPKPAPPAAEVDFSKLSESQWEKLLETPGFFNTPRIKQLREQAAEAEKLKKEQNKAAEQSLVEQKKWEELATKRADENAALQAKLQESNVNHALTGKLVGENVVDLDGALKLVDRSKISVDDNGQVVGVDEALSSLKTDKAYLFTGSGPAQPRVGNPSNPTNPPAAGSGQFKFKESQLTPAFYNEHKAEIDEAGRMGLIEPDGPPQIA